MCRNTFLSLYTQFLNVLYSLRVLTQVLKVFQNLTPTFDTPFQCSCTSLKTFFYIFYNPSQGLPVLLSYYYLSCRTWNFSIYWMFLWVSIFVSFNQSINLFEHFISSSSLPISLWFLFKMFRDFKVKIKSRSLFYWFPTQRCIINRVSYRFLDSWRG